MKLAALSVSTLFIALTTIIVAPRAEAAIDNSPDCDTVAIIKCGVYSATQLRDKAQESDVPKVYAAFGISHSELNGFVDGVVWKDGRVTVGNDQVVARNAITAGRWDSAKSGMTRIADTNRAYKMPTRYFVDEGQTAFIKMTNGRFDFAVIKSCGNPVTGTPTPQPTGKCQSLTQQKTGTNTYRFTAAANVSNGAKVVKYRFDFGDGKTQESTNRTISHTYAKPGNYTARVTVLMDVNGKRVEDTQSACATRIEIEQPPVAATYVCNYMNLTKIGDRRVKLEANHTASGSATFSHYLFDYGDGTPVTQTANNTVEHEYAREGAFTAKVSVVVNTKEGQRTATSDMCAKSITFGTPPPAPPVQEVPGKLADTGPGEVVGAIFAVVAGGTAAYRFVWLRHSL